MLCKIPFSVWLRGCGKSLRFTSGQAAASACCTGLESSDAATMEKGLSAPVETARVGYSTGIKQLISLSLVLAGCMHSLVFKRSFSTGCSFQPLLKVLSFFPSFNCLLLFIIYFNFLLLLFMQNCYAYPNYYKSISPLVAIELK
jgi:hypothetical protein